MCSRPASRQYLAISDMSSSPNLMNSLGSCPFESRSSPLGISFRSSARTDRCCQRHDVTLSTNNRQDNAEPSTMITPGQPIFTQPPNRLSDARRASAFLFEFAIMMRVYNPTTERGFSAVRSPCLKLSMVMSESASWLGPSSFLFSLPFAPSDSSLHSVSPISLLQGSRWRRRQRGRSRASSSSSTLPPIPTFVRKPISSHGSVVWP